MDNLKMIAETAKDFAEKLDAADLVVISLAADNGAYTAAFKNILDRVYRVP